MEGLIALAKRKITAAAISAATVIVLLQATVLPSLFDFITDLILIGLIALVGKLQQSKKD